MEKVDIASTASKYLIKKLVEDYYRVQDVLSEARDQIAKGSEDPKKDQDTLAAENGMLNVDRSEIMEINTGGHDFRNQEQPDPYQGYEAGGSVQQAVGQAPSKGWGQQGVNGCKP